jgi:hypothetical protein
MLREIHHNFSNIVVFVLVRDGAGAERMAIRLAPCEFKRFQARCPAGLSGLAQNARPLECARAGSF